MNIQDVLPRDAIRSIDDPSFGAEHFGDPTDEVLVVDGDPARAYPLRILGHHEIVNDSIDGRPIAVTYCPICASAVVYDRTVDGRSLTFGVSGKLADDALVMYDRETGSEWKQSRGEAIAGDLAGTSLTVLPAAIHTCERFRERHPDGLVLQPAVTGSPREAYDFQRYERYFEREAFGLRGMRGEGPERVWDRTDVDAKTVVLGIERGVHARAYPRPVVRRRGGVVTDTLGDLSVVVFAADGELHAFEDPGVEFEPEGKRFRGDGTTWDGATGESADGRRLRRLPARRLFAFAWQDDHGPGAFFGLEDRRGG